MIILLDNHVCHFDYVRLAKDSKFRFKSEKFPLDTNKLDMIDVDKIISNGDVETIGQLTSQIIHCPTDSGDFRKVFRLAQLAIEYLLFCKMNLEKTIVNLNEEKTFYEKQNKELKEFNAALTNSSDILLEKIRKWERTDSFKCMECPKSFSTRENLRSHKERRHIETQHKCPCDIKFELKEIKEKLDTTTEKLMKNDHLTPRLEDTLNKSFKTVREVLSKFDSLVTLIQNDFKILQILPEETEKKFSKIIQDALSMNLESQTAPPEEIKETKEVIVQTESHIVEKQEKCIQIEQIPDDHVSLKTEEESKSDIFMNTIQLSLKNLESQILVLGEKLESGVKCEKPQPKQRTKFKCNAESGISLKVQDNTSHMEQADNPSSKQNDEKNREQNEESVNKRNELITILPDENQIGNRINPRVQVEYEESEGSGDKSNIIMKPIENLRAEVEKRFNEKLISQGLPVNSKCLPCKTFLKIMKILKHQEKFAKKFYPNYDNIKVKLQENMEETAKILYQKQFQCDSSLRKPVTSSQVVIRREIFESDTDDTMLEESTNCNYLKDPDLNRKHILRRKELKMDEPKRINIKHSMYETDSDDSSTSAEITGIGSYQKYQHSTKLREKHFVKEETSSGSETEKPEDFQKTQYPVLTKTKKPDISSDVEAWNNVPMKDVILDTDSSSSTIYGNYREDVIAQLKKKYIPEEQEDDESTTVNEEDSHSSLLSQLRRKYTLEGGESQDSEMNIYNINNSDKTGVAELTGKQSLEKQMPGMEKSNKIQENPTIFRKGKFQNQYPAVIAEFKKNLILREATTPRAQLGTLKGAQKKHLSFNLECEDSGIAEESCNDEKSRRTPRSTNGSTV